MFYCTTLTEFEHEKTCMEEQTYNRCTFVHIYVSRTYNILYYTLYTRTVLPSHL